MKWLYEKNNQENYQNVQFYNHENQHKKVNQGKLSKDVKMRSYSGDNVEMVSYDSNKEFSGSSNEMNHYIKVFH